MFVCSRGWSIGQSIVFVGFFIIKPVQRDDFSPYTL